MSWLETTFSKILDKNDSFEMGLKLFKTRGSREGFFNNGCTKALFRLEGKTPVEMEQFKMYKMDGPTVSKTSLRNLVGMVSSGQEEDFMCVIVSISVLSDICWNVVR